MDLASSMLEALSGTSKFKRLEQLKRWDDSETNKESAVLKDGPRKINFSDGCVFLAACSAGDKEEVQRLIEKGADIDTANIDGLTALHQACIDDNLEMVEFLVENGADVNRGDNEGWTPLHATASCGFISIAKYLIENGSNVAAVNNDGELPIDIAESEEMEELLQEEINNQGIDCDAARNEEENQMLEDANRWLSSGSFRDRVHPKSGATALHVAAAKGYIKVMNVLMQAGADINAKDFDGWTPLHGAAHWGQKEACEVLVEQMCDMDIKNVAGQTAIDVADPDIIKLLEELRIKQSTILNDNPQSLAILEHNVQIKGKRQMRMGSVDRLLGKDKSHHHNQNEIPLISDKPKRKRDKKNEISVENSGSSENSESEDSEIEKRNKVNKNESLKDDHVEILGTKEGKSNHLRIQEPVKQIPKTIIGENEDDIPVWRRGIKKNETVSSSLDQSNEIIPRSGSGSRSSFTPNSNITNENDEEIPKIDRRRPISLESDERFSKFGMFVWQNRQNRPNSLPASMTTTSTTTIITTTTGTAGIVVTTVTQISAVNSSPLFSRKCDDLHNHSKIPSSDEHVDKLITPVAVVTSLPSTTPSITTTTVTTTTATSPPTPSTPTSNQLRRSFAPPIRDEESETQRKAHAKRVRETRRSTQGVTLEEVKSAEQLIKKQQENSKDKENHSTKGDTVKDRLQELSKDQEQVTGELDRRPSWRVRLEQDKNKIVDDVNVSYRTRETPVEPTVDASNTTTSSTSYVRRSRISSTDNDTVIPSINTNSGTVRTRGSKTEDDIADQDKEADSNLTSSSSTSIQATQAAIHRRRRPKRRSTGVVYTDIDDSDGSQESLEHVKKTEEMEEETDSQTSSDRGFRSRFGSSGSIPDTSTKNDNSRFNDRTSYTATQNEKEEKEYKKLYEELKVDNERLRETLSRKDKELQEYKQRCEKLQLLQKTSSSDAEKRERRALERKLSEYEEELKQMEQLKADNQRLRDENGALIRVISKLSK